MTEPTQSTRTTTPHPATSHPKPGQDPRTAFTPDDDRVRHIDTLFHPDGRAAKAIFELPLGSPPATVDQLDSFARSLAKEAPPAPLVSPEFIDSISGQGTQIWKSPDGRFEVHGEPLGFPPEGGMVRLTFHFP